MTEKRRLPAAGRALVPLLATVLVALLAGTWLMSGALVQAVGPLTVATGRTAVCCAVLTAFAAARSSGRAQLRQVAQRPMLVCLLALLGFAGYAAGTLLAIPRVGTSLTNLVVALMPCAGVAIGALCFGERASARSVVGALLATAATGAYAALGGEGTLDAPGLLLALAGMLGFAVYGFLYRRTLAGLPPLAVLPVLLAVAGVMLLPLALPGLLAHPPSPAQWAGIALLGGAVYAPAYLVQHRLILLRGPVFTAAVQLAVPFTVRIGDWALGTAGAPGATEAALLAAAGAGIALVTLPWRRPGSGVSAPGPSVTPDSVGSADSAGAALPATSPGWPSSTGSRTGGRAGG
ncbi:DMT family transporter [Streptomyces sp. NBC_01280]|uniref:DMT family transporter n=1 Tax=Streptomyces sp. NBC_01280 TaxID=2903810 RepID=UPI002E32EE9C|nr:DMT family transporter [Streptomyces sp. NBC_01280]WSE19165.1 DMT family transporter [Streptomyces sp. NBC_01397]